MMTSSGPFCDVGDHYILLEDFETFGLPGMLDAAGLPAVMFTCEEHKAALIEMSQKKDYTVLPDGNLRRFLEKHKDHIHSGEAAA